MSRPSAKMTKTKDGKIHVTWDNSFPIGAHKAQKMITWLLENKWAFQGVSSNFFGNTLKMSFNPPPPVVKK